jgi:hypothetical protein
MDMKTSLRFTYDAHGYVEPGFGLFSVQGNGARRGLRPVNVVGSPRSQIHFRIRARRLRHPQIIGWRSGPMIANSRYSRLYVRLGRPLRQISQLRRWCLDNRTTDPTDYTLFAIILRSPFSVHRSSIL